MIDPDVHQIFVLQHVANCLSWLRFLVWKGELRSSSFASILTVNAGLGGGRWGSAYDMTSWLIDEGVIEVIDLGVGDFRLLPERLDGLWRELGLDWPSRRYCAHCQDRPSEYWAIVVGQMTGRPHRVCLCDGCFRGSPLTHEELRSFECSVLPMPRGHIGPYLMEEYSWGIPYQHLFKAHEYVFGARRELVELFTW